MELSCCLQVKSLSSLGWFLSIGTFGQIFAALVLVYKLVMNPWEGATTEMVHNGEGPGGTGNSHPFPRPALVVQPVHAMQHCLMMCALPLLNLVVIHHPDPDSKA